MSIKKVKVKEIVEAARKNGYEHHRGGWYKYEGSKLVGACILGQVALNLRVYDLDLERTLNRLALVDYPLNDGTIGNTGIGYAIEYLNDVPVSASDEFHSYEELVNTLEEWLMPYFEIEIDLASANYF